ncbi:benzyl alcohol O-benzoyltransferase-like [Euphorbia lathyris]|uniref:benzyl alcohol O-benzoyltransferase-like n=1 Tax=Euphorbia lathyris TaxID=212925 RepID=UPI0033143A5C
MNQSTISPPLNFHRHEPELITPAKPTPHEFKALSDIDDQDGLRFQIPVIQVYPYNPSMEGVDPVKVIRKAISETLVFYYPFAGRLRELYPSRKLIVECTGEGILFIEADADITLHQSGDSFLPPFTYLEDLLFDVPGSNGVLNCPLLLIQVTRLKCGGFVLALRLNHTMSDGPGLVQFMSAVGEIARGKQVPSIVPVWERHILSATNPPNPTCFHPEYETSNYTNNQEVEDHDHVHRSFFFGSKEISTVRNLIPPHFQHCSTFEILTACMWRCRTIALQPNPTQIMRMTCVVNARYRGFNPPLIPEGYYGNGFVLPTVTSTAEQLIGNPVEYALELIRKAKQGVTREYIQSAVDTVVSKGRSHFEEEGTYIMSDTRGLGFREVDFGWGNAIYGGPPRAIPAMASYYIPYQNRKGENGTLLLLCLPATSMEIFMEELDNMLQQNPRNIKPSL